MDRVLIADDHGLVRDTLAEAVADAGFEVVGRAADGLQAVRSAVELQPDLVLMDISMPVMDGIDATRKLLLRVPDAKVVLLTMYTGENLLAESREAGAVGYVAKDASEEQVVGALEAASNGQTGIGLVDEAPEADDGDGAGLTSRERQVLQLLADGLPPRQIAQRLVLSPRTVRNHLTHAYDKLDVSRRADAVLEAVRLGAVELTDQTESVVP